jgi:uncharacterized membrane protein
MRIKTYLIAQAGIIAAAYIALTLLVAPFAFGSIQFRISEALTALSVLTPAAIPGLFLGCLLSNILNPQNLGLIDIIFGSLATLIAASITWFLSRSIREQDKKLLSWQTGFALLPQVVVNGLIVGSYLPFLLLPPAGHTPLNIALSVLAVAVSEAVVVYLIGVPLLLGLRKTKLILYKSE